MKITKTKTSEKKPIKEYFISFTTRWGRLFGQIHRKQIKREGGQYWTRQNNCFLLKRNAVVNGLCFGYFINIWAFTSLSFYFYAYTCKPIEYLLRNTMKDNYFKDTLFADCESSRHIHSMICVQTIPKRSLNKVTSPKSDKNRKTSLKY